MASLRAQPRDAVEIIHIRDWHDPTDPRQHDHLAMFGPHCVRGSRGAQLVLDLDDAIGSRSNERVVDAVGLNDFEGTTLAEHFLELRKRAGGEPIRVAVVGVWTDAKVSFLLYDLKTRQGIDSLATCSALTAGASRAQHFNALEQLERILGVTCFESVGDLVSWLAPGAAAELPALPVKFGPKIEVVNEAPRLTDTDRDIVGYLYRDSSRITLDPLSGGFSGALVFRASSIDALGHQQAQSVVKLGPHRAIAHERVAFERVEEILGNSAPSVRGFVDFGDRAGIKYSYAAMGQGGVRTLKALFASGAPQATIDTILRSVFEEILGPLYAAARYEKLPILEHYEFAPKWADTVRASIEKIVGRRAGDDVLTFTDAYRATNVCRFYERFLADQAGPATDFHYASIVHGDLNGANILIDGRENVWIIDFFHTGSGHVLKDLAKLENDVQYIFTPLASRDDLREALAITRALRAVEDLREPLPEVLDGLHSAPLVRAWSSIRTLRAIGGRLCREDRNPQQLDVALLRFAVHTLTFDESSALQKEWALAAACGFADDIVAAAEADRVLRVDWVGAPADGDGRVGVTICPGRRDRGRVLDADLRVLSQQGVSRILSLLTEDEISWAGVGQAPGLANALGMEYRNHPLPDQGAPEMADAVSLVGWCLEAVRGGQNVVIHCMGGLGRAGTIAACLLVAQGASSGDAIASVRRARGPRAVETLVQEQFVERFATERGAG
jgi:protein-tyrosine phosphatase/nicotinamidase-related amidase